MGLPEPASRSLCARAQSTPGSVPYAGRPALMRRFMASMPAYRSKRLRRPLVITPARTLPSFIDQMQQLEFRPKGLIAQPLVQLMRPQEHNAHHEPERNLMPAEVVRAGLVALSRDHIFRNSRPRFPAGSQRCCTGFSPAVRNKSLPSADPCHRPGRSAPSGGSLRGVGHARASKAGPQRCRPAESPPGTAEGVRRYPSADAEAGSRWTAWS